ncbi:hypothetical protein SEA_OKANUI_37 [Mycobacterium phage OKaNui]|uniref:Uncharacterized protein n=1 Tax=Mycobacterium phage OKaNui TaxID=2743844 RepID=A0A7D4XJX9_9CAUD|nr:hypothetical protein SEA_OKANUI_37 [Mycobacterium phage OKaNui]
MAQSSSRTDEFGLPDTTEPLLAVLVAGRVHVERVTPDLASIVTAREGHVVSQYMQRLTRFSTAIERTFAELLSTSPESPAETARS